MSAQHTCTPIRYTIVTTCLILRFPLFPAKWVLNLVRRDSTGYLKVFSSTRNQDVFNRSSQCCQLGGGFCIYHKCLSSTSQRFSVGLSCEKFGGQISNLLYNLLSRTIPQPFLLCGRVHYPVGRGHTIREQHVHERVYSLQRCLGRWYVSKQASITQASLLYFLPIVHPGVMRFPAKQCTWIFFLFSVGLSCSIVHPCCLHQWTSVIIGTLTLMPVYHCSLELLVNHNFIYIKLIYFTSSVSYQYAWKHDCGSEVIYLYGRKVGSGFFFL